MSEKRHTIQTYAHNGNKGSTLEAVGDETGKWRFTSITKGTPQHIIDNVSLMMDEFFLDYSEQRRNAPKA